MSKNFLRCISVILIFSVVISSFFLLNVSAIDDLSGESVSISVSQNSVSVYTSIDLDNAKLVLASYDGEKLINLKILTFSLWANSSANLSIPTDFKMVDNGKIKAMVWNNFDDAKPIGCISEFTNHVYNYGYLAAGAINDLTGGTKFRMVACSGGARQYNGAEKIKIDDVTYSNPDEILNKLKSVVSDYSLSFENHVPLYDNGSFINVDGYGTDASQLVKYTTDINGEINSIDTVASGGELNVFDKNSSSSWTFTSGTLQFSRKDESGMLQQIKIDSNTIIFAIPPYDRNLYDDYAMKKYSSTLLKSGSSYQVEAYDVDPVKFNTAKVILLYGGNPEAFVTADTPAAVVTGIGHETIGSEVLPKLTVYIAGIEVYSGEQAVYAENDATVADVQIGDVIRYGKTSKGYIKEGTVQRLVSVSGTDIEPIMTDQNNSPLYSPLFANASGKLSSGGYDYRVVHGLLYYATDDMMQIAPTGTRTKEAVDSAASTDLQTLPLSSTTKYYVYDPNCNPNQPITESIGIMSGYISYLGDGIGTDLTAEQAQEVFAFEQDGYVRMVYIINRL